MSQHLITDFINRTHVFTAFNESKIANQDIKKYKGSDRKNNISPAMAAQSARASPQNAGKKDQTEEQKEEGSSEDKHIDIII